MLTRFGLQVKAFVRYEWNSDSIWNLGGSLYPYASQYWTKNSDRPWWEILKKKKGLLGFWCRHCRKALPKEMDEEILDYLHKKTLLAKLTNNHETY